MFSFVFKGIKVIQGLHFLLRVQFLSCNVRTEVCVVTDSYAVDWQSEVCCDSCRLIGVGCDSRIICKAFRNPGVKVTNGVRFVKYKV